MPDWTCPFCALLCDGFALDEPARPRLVGSDCPRARAALAQHVRPDTPAAPSIDGRPATLDEAIAEAARRLAQWRQPLFGGLGTDVAGARALVRLAVHTGAICDHADGAAMVQGLRALQDRGQYTATLGELRTRAELIVCVGTPAIERYPEFFRRCGLGEPHSPCTRLVFLGTPPPEHLPAGVVVQALPGSGDLFADLQQLALRVGGRTPRTADAALAALAGHLKEARYAVLVHEPGRLPAQGALLIEAVQRIVATLNGSTRAASFALGGSDGATTAQQVHTWLTGLPLRSRAGPGGLEHEPLRFGAARLLDDGAVDGLLWVSSFDPARTPPAGTLPRIVLAPPAAAPSAGGEGVFVPVATPGLNAPGHLFRADTVIVVPLEAVREDGLPGVDEVLGRMADRMGAPR